jgi:hypothetical protein
VVREKKIEEIILLFYSFKGQYIVAIFYGLITYYAFPDTWLQKPIPSLFIGICTALAIALGREIEFK